MHDTYTIPLTFTIDYLEKKKKKTHTHIYPHQLYQNFAPLE